MALVQDHLRIQYKYKKLKQSFWRIVEEKIKNYLEYTKVEDKVDHPVIQQSPI